MSNTFDKLSVLDSFIEEVNSYLPEIEANLERLAQSSDDMDALEETYRHAHTIGGSASMMDFPGLAHVAHGMEDILGDVMDGLSILDEPTLGLLRRSFGRMRRLVEGIHDRVDEDAVIAEDDTDYVQYRTLLDTSSQPTAVIPTPVNSNSQTNEVSDPLFDEESSLVLPSSSPSLDEVLASFRTPSVTAGENIALPEKAVQSTVQPASAESAPTSASALHASQQEEQTPVEAVSPPASVRVNGSAFDTLIASTRDPFSQEAPPVTSPSSNPFTPEGHEQQPASSLVQTRGHSAPSNVQAFPAIYANMQEETEALQVQSSSLKAIRDQLRMAMSVIEGQRAEFKGFLDGSKDALERMEDWAGRAMGLNLRNSPEQVRRYLPLSVMWVSNKELKKVLDLLKQITSGVEMTDEQVHGVLQQLSFSIASCGEAFQQLQSQTATPAHILTQEPGWDAWEMQTSLHPEELRERVTFERRGDLAALRAEIEVRVREELRREYDAAVHEEMSREEARLREQIWHEYEDRSLTLAARSKLEQQIRNEVRQEFEAKQQVQEHASAPRYTESPYEMEARLRSEIEIQVRQEFLDLITASGANLLNPATSQTLMPPAQPPVRTSNFIEQAQHATGVVSTTPPAPGVPQKGPTDTAPGSSSPVVSSKPVSPVSSVSPAPAAAKPLSSASAFGADLGEEAAEIFRLEAEEHLQTISMHVAALEKSPDNRELIQGIRRATHTLKGAASMMGFRAIADLSHISEDLLDSIMDGSTTISPAVLSLIFDTAETLDQLITGRESDSTDEAKVQVLRVRYVELLGEHSTTRDAEEDIDVDDVSDESIEGEPSVAGVVAGAQPAETNAQRAVRGDLSVRVRLQKLDELVNLFGELLVNRSILEERIERLVRLVADVGVSSTRLRDVGQKLESRFEAATLPSGHSVQVMPGEGDRSMGYSLSRNGNKTHEPSHISEFDELELDRYTEFHQLARGLSEGISDMTTLSTEMEAVISECEGVFARENRLNTTFQDRLMKARLVPLSTMTPRLYRAARAVALKQQKEFEFVVEGQETEVDRTVIEEI